MTPLDCGSLLPLWAMQPAASPVLILHLPIDSFNSTPLRLSVFISSQRKAATDLRVGMFSQELHQPFIMTWWNGLVLQRGTS